MTEKQFFKKIEKTKLFGTGVLCTEITCEKCLVKSECKEEIDETEESIVEFAIRLNNFLENKLIQYKAKILSKKI